MSEPRLHLPACPHHHSFFILLFFLACPRLFLRIDAVTFFFIHPCCSLSSLCHAIHDDDDGSPCSRMHGMTLQAAAVCSDCWAAVDVVAVRSLASRAPEAPVARPGQQHARRPFASHTLLPHAMRCHACYTMDIVQYPALPWPPSWSGTAIDLI